MPREWERDASVNKRWLCTDRYFERGPLQFTWRGWGREFETEARGRASTASAPALCYNLREAPRPEERNPQYGARLQGVLRKLEFPADYVASVA